MLRECVPSDPTLGGTTSHNTKTGRGTSPVRPMGRSDWIANEGYAGRAAWPATAKPVKTNYQARSSVASPSIRCPSTPGWAWSLSAAVRWRGGGPNEESGTTEHANGEEKA